MALPLWMLWALVFVGTVALLVAVEIVVDMRAPEHADAYFIAIVLVAVAAIAVVAFLHFGRFV